ncbi:MAG: hypothetical protein ABI349_15725, partial [Casimicrobiaceae bacterium]
LHAGINRCHIGPIERGMAIPLMQVLVQLALCAYMYPDFVKSGAIRRLENLLRSGTCNLIAESQRRSDAMAR